ncbi:hypothetical protein B0H34DRAFT_103627 [Crassisporium funariophilum]|nr:hypothetical protein B0H34DRAFT_103627 [Crassisporium funariophilum]
MMTRSTAPALLTPTSGLNEVMQPSWQEPHHEAHQAIPPEKRSSYSELTANVEFLAKLKEQSCSLARPPQPSHSPQQVFRKRVHIRRLLPALRSSSRSEPKSSPMTLIPMDAANNPHVHPSHTLPAPPSLTPSPSSPKVSFQSPADSSASGHQIGARNVKEPRRPSLACTFCRERKIACGRPPEGSSDLTCNQCARRSFRCEYVNEYRLGRPRLRQSTRRR